MSELRNQLAESKANCKAMIADLEERLGPNVAFPVSMKLLDTIIAIERLDTELAICQL